MTRVIAAAGALLAITALAAGCGASGWQASADQLGRTWGDPHPTIVEMESVQLATGTRAEIMQLRGHFTLASSCNPILSRAHRKCGGAVHLDTVVGAVNAHDHKLIEVGNDNTAAELAAFRSARSARPMFRIFPEFSSPLVQCAIPGFGGRTITGICTIRVADVPPHGRTIAVALIEHWPLTGSGSRPYSGGWIVTVGRSGRALSVSRTGDLPPQLWKSAKQPPVAPLAVVRARRERGFLRIFPALPGKTIRCSIPSPLLGGSTFRGSCTTKLLPRDGNRPRLAFIERWHARHRTLSGAWIVTLRHDDTVLRVQATGAVREQLAED